MILDNTDQSKKKYNTLSEKLWIDLLLFVESNYPPVKDDNGEFDNKLDTSLLELFHQSNEDNFYWPYCSGKVYADTFKDRVEDFIKDKPNLTEFDFAKKELNLLKLRTEDNIGFLFDYMVVKSENGKKTKTRKAFYFHVYSPLLHKNIEEEKFRKKVFLKNILRESTKTKKYSDSDSNRPEFPAQHEIEDGSLAEQKDFMEIFLNNGFELFKYLNENYTVDNNSPKAKYSFLYHFLHSNGYIMNRKQGKYIEGIKKHHSETLSKIQQVQDNYKYQNDVRAKLAEYELKFLDKR